MAISKVVVVDGNNLIVQIDRGVAGRGITDVQPVEIDNSLYLEFYFTDGTTETVGPVGTIQYIGQSPIVVNASTISLSTVPVTLGGTGQITANAGFNALAPSQTSNTGKYLKTDGTNTSWDLLDISTGDITGTLPVTNGGTGATTASGARTNLAAAASATTISAGTGLSGGGDLSANRTISLADTAVVAGAYGSASKTLTATVNAQGQLTALSASDIAIANTQVSGLGTMSTQNANNVSITGGSVTGITDLAIADGGTGQSTAAAAITALTGTQVAGRYLRSDGTNAALSAIQAADVPTLNQNTTGTAAGLSATLAIASGGTGQTTANTAFNALAPSQIGNSGKYLTTDGSNTSWATNPLGTVTSVDVSGGTTGLTTSGGPVTTSGTITLAGTLATTNGGTGLTSFTANGVVYASSTSALATGSALTFDGTTLGVSSGGSTPALKLYGAAVTQGQLQFSSTAGYVIQGGPDYTGLVYNVGSATYQHIWQINGSEQMRLTFTGLGIATSSPQYKADVAGNIGINSVGSSGNGLIGYAGASPSTGFRFSLTRQDAIAAGSIYLNSYGAIGFGINKGATGTPADAPNMLLDSSGNLGLGVTPSAWGTAKAFQGYSGGFALSADGTNNNQMRLSSNTYFNGTNWIYYGSSNATSYEQRVGEHRWYNAASGTAGAAITFTQAMSLTAAGNLVLGTTDSDFRLSSLVQSGADRDVFQAAIIGASNGFRIKWNHATSTTRVNISNLPTSATGLASGDLWNDGGTLKVA